MEYLIEWLSHQNLLIAMLLMLPLGIASELYNFLPLRVKRSDDKDMT